MLSLPERHIANPHWQHTGDLLLTAAAGDEKALDSFDAVLERSLKFEGLIPWLDRKPKG